MPPVKPGKGKHSKARIGIIPKKRSTATTVSTICDTTCRIMCIILSYYAYYMLY